jgi:hypothetical protein
MVAVGFSHYLCLAKGLRGGNRDIGKLREFDLLISVEHISKVAVAIVSRFVHRVYR